MDGIKSDLNVHVDGYANNKEALIKILTLAEENGVKAISLLEQDALNLYKEKSVFCDMVKSGEVENYYTGKLIAGCELTCTVNNTDPTKYAFNFNGHNVHITLLNFDVKFVEGLKWFDPKFKAKCIQKDIKPFCKLLKQYGIEIPKKNYFGYHKGLAYQLWDYMHEDDKRLKKFESIVGHYPNVFSFVKNLFEDPTSKLYFKPSYIPYLTDVLSFARKAKGRIYISHPNYMNQKFNTISYLEALINVKTEYGFPFDGIEVYDGQNSVIETKVLSDYARTRNLEVSGNGEFRYLYSESNPEGKAMIMYDNAKHYYVPKPGFLVKNFMETRQGDLILNERFIDRFEDIRETPRFE